MSVNNPDIQQSNNRRSADQDLHHPNLTASSEAAAPLRSDHEPKPSRTTEPHDGPEQDDFHPGLRLWIVIIGLGVTLLLTALENTAITVAIPIIVSELELGEKYIWVTNAFFISRCVLVPSFLS